MSLSGILEWARLHFFGKYGMIIWMLFFKVFPCYGMVVLYSGVLESGFL